MIIHYTKNLISKAVYYIAPACVQKSEMLIYKNYSVNIIFYGINSKEIRQGYPSACDAVADWMVSIYNYMIWGIIACSCCQ